MFEKFDDDGRRIVIRAHDRAMELGHDRVGTGHLFLALLRDWEDVSMVFGNLGSPERLAAIVESQAAPPPPAADGENPVITRDLKVVLDRAIEMSRSQSGAVTPAYLLLSSLDGFEEAFREAGIDAVSLRESLREFILIAKPKPREEACPTCGAPTKDFGHVRDLKIEVEGGTAISVYAYFCSRCGSTYGLVKSDGEEV